MICIGFASQAVASQPSFLTEKHVAHSLVSEGDTTRLQRVLAQASEGKPVTIAFVGGSITQGLKASVPQNRYVDLVGDWWKQTFPNSSLTIVNAGIGSTGSDYGTLRLKRDVLTKQPDLVFVDFAVNDKTTRELAETYEGLVRQLLHDPGQPALLLLFMVRNDGVNAQVWQEKIGRYYHLPMISCRNALWPDIEAGRLAWNQIGGDNIHPNDAGHACVAAFIQHFIQVVVDTPGHASEHAGNDVDALPEPLLTDRFENVTLMEAADIRPVENNGWRFDAETKAWTSQNPGSVVTFEVSGRQIFLMQFRIHGPMGKVAVRVDDAAPVLFNGWLRPVTNGYRNTALLARDLDPSPHRVRIELLDEKSPESTGHEFRLLGLGSADSTASVSGVSK
jgi:lysophospholipase L1-like esterase